jgi:transposase
MDYHHHARLTVHGRECLAREVLEGGLRLGEAAAKRRLSRQTVSKWVKRYRVEGAGCGRVAGS